MDQKEYMKLRVEDQEKWYSDKSTYNKRMYLSLKLIEIFSAISIPFFVGYITTQINWIQITAGVLGIVTAVCSATLGLFKYYENWIDYRSTSETIKQEKFGSINKSVGR
jgi:Protein of unknown function (DUF4231)